MTSCYSGGTKQTTKCEGLFKQGRSDHSCDKTLTYYTVLLETDLQRRRERETGKRNRTKHYEVKPSKGIGDTHVQTVLVGKAAPWRAFAFGCLHKGWLRKHSHSHDPPAPVGRALQCPAQWVVCRDGARAALEKRVGRRQGRAHARHGDSRETPGIPLKVGDNSYTANLPLYLWQLKSPRETLPARTEASQRSFPVWTN